ncbi:putative quinol monooxygenase [Nitratireductor sp. GCM10026969]|uniref:putative quinol monooxygenase n=1 Tax=Nitratireductor sp. GCM10026969 TaxID=3252645 RepID=UPI003621349A
MLVIAGHFKVPADQRKAFVEAHADLIRRARAYPGCLNLSISEDPFDPSRVNLMELWESEAILEAWRKISNPPKTDIQFEGGNVQKHHISHSGPPF